MHWTRGSSDRLNRGREFAGIDTWGGHEWTNWILIKLTTECVAAERSQDRVHWNNFRELQRSRIVTGFMSKKT